MVQTVFFKNLALSSPPNPPIHGFTHGVAYFSAARWWYSGLNYGGSAQVVPINQSDLPSLKAWIQGIFCDPEPKESDYRPGTAYKRIWRSLNTPGNLNKAIDESAMNQSSVALKLLLTKMEDIFETVEPSQTNLQTYGHKIRELLLLASMEVEASWAAVLKANGYAGDRWRTSDYVKLLAPMLLDSFSLKLRSYPAFPVIAAFKGWDALRPTKSLGWYDAYNQTKHNREENLGLATLERAVNAVGAAVIMFHGQFGHSYQQNIEGSSHVRGIFNLSIDSSMYPTACYIPNAEGGTKAREWEMLNYPFPPG